MDFYAVKTPKADEALERFSLITPDGTNLKDSITQGQKIIMETILTRKAPDGTNRNRIHCETITRYGKSLIVGASVAIRAFTCKEPWAIVAPTQDKAQIIMDYVINFSTKDPLMRGGMIIDPPELDKIDKLKEHKAKNHITFKRGGQVRAFTAGQKSSSNTSSGDALMGFGCPNVIEDECYLIDDNTHSKVMRMLGDNPHDNFLFKIGNPFNRGHGLASRRDEKYFRIVIDYKVALIEGRLSEQLLDEMRDKPNFSVLYECLPPDAEAVDNHGYYQLFTERLLQNAQVENEAIKGFGKRVDGVDVADGGENLSVICSRFTNVAKFEFENKSSNAIELCTHISIVSEKANEIKIDGTGVGTGTAETMQKHPYLGERTENVKVGDKSTEPDKFANLRAEIYWKAKIWLEQGGKLVKHPAWEQLLDVKYKVNSRGQIQIISKDELRRQQVPSPDHADSFALTFVPELPSVSNVQAGGIVGYPEFGV